MHSLYAPWTIPPGYFWVDWFNYTDYFTFYALPAEGRTQIVTVEATLADGRTKMYFPVHFGTSDTGGVPFENGKLYQMTIELYGDARTDGGGSTDPEIRPGPAQVTVTVKSAEWQVEDLPEKNF